MKLGRIPYGILLMMFFSLTISSFADENRWSTSGPYGARVYTIAIHPFDTHLTTSEFTSGQ
jgi:hypothetical protein